MNRNSLIAFALFGLLVAYSASRSQAKPPPSTMKYQGRLTDQNGSPLQGTVDLTFRMFSSDTPLDGTTFVWGEVHQAVQVQRGVFTVELGAGTQTISTFGAAPVAGANPLSPDDFSGERWVQVQVGGNAPMNPPNRLGAVPYAIVAGGAVPIGSVIDWVPTSQGAAPPAGWAICDGSTINDPQSPLDGRPTPNLTLRFTRGVQSSQIGTTGYAAAPGGGANLPDIGGIEFQALSHNHSASGHSHGIPAHDHSAGSHTHSVNIVTSVDQNRSIFPGPGATHRTDFLAGDEDHRHSVNGNTGPASGNTGPGVVIGSGGSLLSFTHSSADSISTTGQSFDNRPPFVGVVKIMRIY